MTARFLTFLAAQLAVQGFIFKEAAFSYLFFILWNAFTSCSSFLVASFELF